MKITSQVTKLVLFMGLGSYLIGCGQGIQLGSQTPEEAVQTAEAVDQQQLKLAVDQSKIAMVNAQAALSVIVDPTTGSFNWDIFLGGVDFSEVATDTKICLDAAFPNTNILMRVFTAPKDIAKALKCILDDVVIAAGVANTTLNSALDTLTKAQANTTAGSPQYLAIQAMIDQVNTLKSGYKVALQTMASQLTIVTTALNQLPTLATGAIPVPILSILVGYSVGQFIQPVIYEIMSFQAQINAL